MWQLHARRAGLLARLRHVLQLLLRLGAHGVQLADVIVQVGDVRLGRCPHPRRCHLWGQRSRRVLAALFMHATGPVVCFQPIPGDTELSPSLPFQPEASQAADRPETGQARLLRQVLHDLPAETRQPMGAGL